MSKEKNIEKTSQYISEAETRGTDRTLHPWEAVDSEQKKVFSLRLPLDYHEKLKYIAKKTPRTNMNNLCLDGLEPFIDERLEEILKKEKGEE